MKVRYFTIWALLLLVVIGSCKKEITSDDNTNEVFPKNISFAVIKQGDLSSAYNGAEWTGYVVNDSITWATYYNNPFFAISDTNANINFDSFSVVAVFDSVRPSAPAPISVLSIKEYEDSIVVNTTSGCCGALDAINYPYELVRTSKLTTKPIICH